MWLQLDRTGVEDLAVQMSNKFKKYSDKKLKNFIDLWEQCPVTRSLNSVEIYIEALTESYKRFKDESFWKIEYFKKHPENTIDQFQLWFREAEVMSKDSFF